MMTLFLIALVLGCIAALIGLGIMRGSAQEQKHYEQVYSEYIAKQDKHGVHLN